MTDRAAVAVVTCVTQSWLAPALVTMLSVSQQLNKKEADLIIICDTLDREGRADAFEFIQHHNIQVEIRTFALDDFQKIDPGRYSLAAFLRLCLPQILEKDYQRVLYLDSDILALAPLDVLLSADLADLPLGAVPEIKLTSGRGILTDRYRKKIGLDAHAEYFNSGVLLFDWQKTLASGLISKSKELLLAGQTFRFADQDALNLTFANKWHALPIKWNVEQSAINYLNLAPALRHFNHSAKPWWNKNVVGYRQYHAFYTAALRGLALENFLRKKGNGSSLLANIEFLWRKMSLHQRRFLRKRFAHLI